MVVPSWMPVIIYAVIVLIFLGFYAWQNMDDSIGRQPFVMLVFLTIVMLVSDFISRLYIYEDAPHLIVAGANVITFLAMPAIGAEWFQYIRSILTAEERLRMRTLNNVVSVIVTIAFIIILLTPVTSWVYYFDANGYYHRGDLFIVPATATFIILLATAGYLLLRVKSLERYSIRILAAFLLPPAVGAVLAMVVPDVPWIPLGVSVSMVALFAHIQNTGMTNDYLTGLANRKKLEELLSERIGRAQAGYSFAGIMMDIDNFKRINDTLGHAVGDIALADTARLLKRSVRSGDAVARFGGDEFFVLLDIDEPSDLKNIVARIEEEERVFASEEHDYVLRLSKGYDFFDPEKFSTIQDFEQHLDALMYADKDAHRLEQVTPQRASEGQVLSPA